jgi:hypothetical protein
MYECLENEVKRNDDSGSSSEVLTRCRSYSDWYACHGSDSRVAPRMRRFLRSRRPRRGEEATKFWAFILSTTTRCLQAR